MAQTKTEIRALLEGAGIRPLKRYGQHFLIDGNLMQKLVAAAEIRRDDVVLEVGPGTGSLTELLLERAGHVVAVEIDRGLHTLCRQRLATRHGPDASRRLTLLHEDVLARKTAVADMVLRSLVDRQRDVGGRILLVANLPYQVATPLVVDLLLGDVAVSPMCFTVQAEVADRIVAEPGTKAYGPVSILAQALARVQRIANVPAAAFWPVPKVESTMLRVDLRGEEGPTGALRQRLAELVHACFIHRRKTMKHNLQRVVDASTFERVAGDGRWDLAARPERFTVAQWCELAEMLADTA